MCLAPGMIDRPVFCGHWGETPDYPGKLAKLRDFGTRFMPESDKIQLLRNSRIKYMIFSEKPWADASKEAGEETDNLLPFFRGNLPTPPYLKLRYQNPYADVYEVVL